MKEMLFPCLCQFSSSTHHSGIDVHEQWHPNLSIDVRENLNLYSQLKLVHLRELSTQWLCVFFKLVMLLILIDLALDYLLMSHVESNVFSMPALMHPWMYMNKGISWNHVCITSTEKALRLCNVATIIWVNSSIFPFLQKLKFYELCIYPCV